MNNEKLLSGHELVSKGATKIEATLPEIGMKDVVPSGSWLEQKQIQAAIEARKHLIEVERIEKSGSLSHAVWREEFKLAEVTQKVGGYWQYLGHNRGARLFLKPEEALFLMEINCLHIKYHDVKVSLQQAYTLLLRDKVTLLQYKVYASLSRLGYRVYRHEKLETLINEKKNNVFPTTEKINNINTENANENRTKTIPENLTKNIDSQNFILNSQKKENCSKENFVIVKDNEENKNTIKRNKDNYALKKLQKLKDRLLKPCNIKHINKFLENIPELTDKTIVSIRAPLKQFIPKSINLNKSVFKINLENIKIKNDRSDSNETNIYTNDEVNGNHIRRLRHSSNRSEFVPIPPYPNFVFSHGNIPYRQFNFWRPRQNMHYINFNMLFQRQYFWCFNPRGVQLPRVQTPFMQTNFNNSNRDLNYENRPNLNTQMQNLEEIKKLAFRLKQLILRGNTPEPHILSLQRLIQCYNLKYKTRVRLSGDFDIITDENIVDTIELDDDEEPNRKKRRKSQIILDDNLNMLKKFATQLRELEKNNKSSARHRRAFSKLLKTFNESYNEEYYLSERYEIENRRPNQLDISESSSSECVVEELKFRKRKRLRNPFNILKRLSERLKESSVEASTSRNETCIEAKGPKHEYSEILLKIFSDNWLPPNNDFGRAEIVAQTDVASEIDDIKREEFLFDFLKIQNCICNNWLDLKKSFFSSVKQAITEFQNSVPTVMNNRVNSIIKPGDCTEMTSILKQLRIIQTAIDVDGECNYTIDFDVYNRDVQNFRKSKKPTPHFRIICFDEKERRPSGREIASLHSKYDDNVVIVFAIVGIDSISYMQITPTNLPVHISSNT